jgi:hypothetical protein
VGVKLFSYLAGIALLVAAVAFARYSVAHGWLRPEVRMTLGVLAGIALLAGCETRRARAYAVTAQSLTAAGVATLFTTFYASTALWHLLPAWAAFLLMALVTAVAVALSIRRDAVVIALLGLVGGFATPVLLSTGEDRPLGLFGYLALLNLGLGWVAYRKRWPLLSALALAGTVLYQLGWTVRFLGEGNLVIGAAVFLLFPLLTIGRFLLAAAQTGEGDEPPPALFRHAAALSALPSLLFAFHLAATPEYARHFGLMFGFLFLVAAGLAVVAVAAGPEWLHALGAVTVLGVFAVWAGSGYTSEAWPALLALLALFAALYLGVPWAQARLRRKRPFQGPALLAVYAAPLLLFLFPALVFLEPATRNPGLLFGVLLGLLALVAATAVRFGEGWLHLLACAAALAAEAAWSARWLEPGRLLPALLIYGGFALFYLAVPFLAERQGKPLGPRAGGSWLLLASLGLLAFLASGPLVAQSLGGLALLLGLLVLGLLFEAGRGRSPAYSLVGMLAGWGLLALWGGQALAQPGALTAANLLAPLAALTAFALLVLLGRSWLRLSGREAASASTAAGVPLEWAGHLALLVVASRPELAFPAWPWLAVLLVLQLALGVAALARREDRSLAGGALLTQLVLIFWTVGAASQGHPPAQLPAAAPWIGLGFAGLGLLWFELGRARGVRLEWSAGLGLLAAQGLLAALRSQGMAGPFPILAAIHLALALGLLALAWRSGRQAWAVALACSSGLVWLAAGGLEGAAPAGQQLVLTTVLLLPQLANPLLLGARARGDRLPYFAALAASAFAFLAARPALMALGCGPVIGALPVLLALLLVPHVVLLLRLQPPEQRDLARLAWVAGVILVFVTVAIPLQLEREWITLGWALQGLALAWLFRRVPHRGLLLWDWGLFAAVFIRLACNPSVLEYHPRLPVPVWNWYLYAYLTAAACCFGAARLLRGREPEPAAGVPRLGRALPGAGAVLLFLLLNLEIADGFSTGPVLTFNLRGGGLAQDLSYTLGWALFALGLLAAGILARERVARFAAIALLTVTVLKTFLHDLARLEGLYRVASFVGLAFSLALVAVALQKYVLRKERA